MDIPRQRPEPAPRSRTAAPLRALRYTVVSVWLLAVGVTVNIAMFWLVDRLTH